MVQLRKERGADQLWAEAWRWRENLQRAIDGCHTTDEMSSAGLAAYSELKGPNMPLPCGYTVSSQAFKSLAILGLELVLPCYTFFVH